MYVHFIVFFLLQLFKNASNNVYIYITSFSYFNLQNILTTFDCKKTETQFKQVIIFSLKNWNQSYNYWNNTRVSFAFIEPEFSDKELISYKIYVNFPCLTSVLSFQKLPGMPLLHEWDVN